MTTTAEALGLLIDPEPHLSPAEIVAQRREALGGRKFEAADVDFDLRKQVRAYLLGLTPEEAAASDFVAAMVEKVDSLSANMVKGVANWASAQVQRAKAKNEPANDSMKTLLDAIPEGRYAVEFTDGLRFYRVRRPKKGNWVGTTFIDHIIGGGSDYYRVATPKTERDQATQAIADDPLAAGYRFSVEAKVCARCLKALSDEQSRSRGYGPDCWEVVSK